MKELLLIPIMLAMFAFGYFVIARVDAFLEENSRELQLENRKNRCHIRIAAESPALLDSIAEQLRACAAANPNLELFLSTGRADRILQRLLGEGVDIALLTGKGAAHLEDPCAWLRIPCRVGTVLSPSLGLSVESVDIEPWVYVVWNKSVQSKDRDRVLFSLEAAFCTLTRGYPDYLD